MKRNLLNNMGLKLISLVLAIIAWVYIVGELNKATPEERAALERLLPYRMAAKFLPIQVNFTGKAKAGYEIVTDGVTINPDGIVVIGPRSLLDKTSFIKTEPVDVSDHMKSFSKDVSLIPMAKGLSVKEKLVTIDVPIKKARD